MAKIYLDAGHGGADSGAVNNLRREKDDTLRLTLSIGKILAAQGVEVLYSRTGDTSTRIADIAAQANTADAAYTLSIHRNSANALANGLEIWIHSAAGDKTRNAAEKVYIATLESSGYHARGIKYGMPSGGDFGINRLTKMPAALLEVGFISNDSDNSIFDAKFDDMAVAIAKALCEIVGVTYKGDSKPPQPDYPVPTRNLSRNDSGEDVKWVQARLQPLGYNVGDIDGIFGTKTDTAVRIYQKDNGLSVDGIVGANTRAVLAGESLPVNKPKNPYNKPTGNILRGSRGDGVRWVQWHLVRQGYTIGSSGIDGDFGKATDTAVRSFQRDKNLASDGIVGTKTRAALEG